MTEPFFINIQIDDIDLGGWGPVPGRHESLQFLNVN